MSVRPTADGVHFELCREKAAKYQEIIHRAIDSETLSAGDSVKLAGRLMWTTQHLFHRVGRAIIKPVFAQKLSKSAMHPQQPSCFSVLLCRCGKVGTRLLAALRWWAIVLAQNISELRPWQRIKTPPCHVFVDAASSPAQCGAVAFIDGRVLFTSARPNDQIWQQFAARQDRQITGLEILACAIALSTFQSEIAGRVVCLYSDNTGIVLRQILHYDVPVV